MLLKRIVTAVILIPLVLCAIFYLTPRMFYVVTGIVLSLALWEWAAVVGIKSYWLRFLLLVMLWALFFARGHIPIMWLLWVAVAIWLLAAGLVFSYSKGGAARRSRTFYAIFGMLIVICCWLPLNLLKGKDPRLVLLVLFIIWAADSGAYFAGRLFGKHKLAPRISPNKTIEGLCGGVICALIVGWVFAFLNHLACKHLFGLLILSVIVALFSVMGDLFESMVKRQAQLKDSGNLLPGHGGLLDRVDSMLAAVPIFVLGVILLGL